MSRRSCGRGRPQDPRFPASALRIVHPVIPSLGVALFFLRTQNPKELQVMIRIYKTLISLSIMTIAMTGCVVAPAGYYHRGSYGPRVAVVAPAPVIVVRPYR